MAAMLMVAIPAMATISFAQTQGYNSDNRQYQSEGQQYQNDNNHYYDGSGYYQGNRRPNVYQRHRKVLNIAIATGAGAIIGALIGGKKGALIGAGAGVGAGLIINRKQSKNYYRRY